jgi:cell division initiation protein
MKLTALDIHHKEFGRALRGYNEEQVDAFLDQVADEFERLFKENIDLNERLDAADERVRGYQQIESSLNATLLQAQRSSEETVKKAAVDADSILRDAEHKAKEIIHNALQRKQAVANELIRIKAAEEDFRARYKALLEDKLHSVNEINLPDDVSLLLGETDTGVVGDVSVRASAQAPASASFPVPSPSAPPASVSASPAESPSSGADQQTMAMPPLDPPSPGFVQSVALGELGGPALEPEVELVEPGEFNLPGFDSFGEREDDHDIEEID